MSGGVRVELVDEVLWQLDAGLRAVDALLSDRRPAGEAQELAVGLRRMLDRLDVACTRALRAVASCPSPLPDGHISIASWWADAGVTARGEAGSRSAQQRVLDHLPRFAEAVTDGSVGVAHLRVLAAAVTDDRVDFARRDDSVLTDAAVKLDVHRFRQLVRHWQALCDDALGNPSGDDDLEGRRRFRLVQMRDGMWHVEGLLESAVGGALSASMSAASSPPAPGDTRTARQRAHDTFADLVAAFQRGDGSGVAASVSVIVDATTGQGSTTAGWVMPAWRRDWYLCECEVRMIAVSDTGEPIGVGANVKMVPVHVRAAVVARDRWCRFPGCDRPARWCDVHHLVPRAAGGTNAIRNLALLCRRHHRMVHRLSLRLRFEDDGVTFVVTFPVGTERVDHAPPKLRGSPAAA
jgi:hypothetical protein